MKFNRFYPLFFILLLLTWIVSCTQNKSTTSSETKQVIAKVNLLLEQAKSENLSETQKLECIDQAHTLAKKAAIDSLILKTFNEKAEFYNIHYPDNALTVLKEFEKMTNSKNDTLYIAYSFLNFGEYYYNLKQKDTAFNYFNKSTEAFKKSKDSINVVYSLLMMSGILNEKSDYYDMEAVNTDALKFINTTDKNYKYNYSCVYNNLGIAFKETFDYEKSLQFYKKARQYAQNNFARMVLENNIAAIYTLSNQPQKALDILIPLDEAKSQEKNTTINALISNNIGLAYLKLKDPKSLAYFLKGLAFRQKENDKFGLINSYAHLANYYKTNNNTMALAKKYALKSHQEAIKMGLAEERLTALELLATTSYGVASSDYLKAYFKLNDSLVKVKQKNKNQFAKMRYDFSQQLEQNQLLKTQEVEKNLKIATSQNQILILIFLGLISIGFAFFRLNYLKQKSKKEILQEGYNTETRISKQLHDELANDVYHVMTFAETQPLDDENNKETLLHNLDTIYKRTRNISKENSVIDTGPNFENHLKEMMVNFSSNEVNVLINGIDSIPFSVLENHKKIIIYRVLQELLVNMKKHSQCSIVVLSFKKTDRQIQIDYSDNGTGGMATDKITLKNGLLNMENRIASINGTLNFVTVTGKGFKASFTVPV
jgi:signal transduction histidine kinase